MLFNSYTFLFLFLPVTLLVFYRIGARGHHRIAIAWLVGASLFFYAWWNPAYLGLLLGSILFNYACGVSLSNQPNRPLLFFGISANLALLGWFKYAGFFSENINDVFGLGLPALNILLPLAISFFTFQQITYLIDAHRGETREYNFLHYCLFVTFFPQLIAGPIVHHREMLPQFANADTYRPQWEHLAVGTTIFAIGLFKKVVIADSFAVYATPVFDAAAQSGSITFFEAWGGALAYTLQLYFDFSGYSDMAIGLARMFGIRLPLNFDSPYKANNIIDFWRRWHITLSRFLRDYLYIPLGGNRLGKVRRHINLLVTMLLGGLWHGAGWNFIVWGGLHGVFLIINHGWRETRKRLGHDLQQQSLAGIWSARIVTFLAVVIAWVFFRATDMQSAGYLLSVMFGQHGIVIDSSSQLAAFGFLPMLGVEFGTLEVLSGSTPYSSILFGLLLIWSLPNTQQLMAGYRPALEVAQTPSQGSGRLRWRPSLRWSGFTASLLVISILMLSRVSEFLYFRF